VDTYPQAGLDAPGDSTRMAIFEKLGNRPMAVHELAASLPVSRPAVSQHLRVLKEAGLVADHKIRTRRVYRMSPQGIARLRAHFEEIWEPAMRGFESRLEEENPKKTGEKHGKHRR